MSRGAVVAELTELRDAGGGTASSSLGGGGWGGGWGGGTASSEAWRGCFAGGSSSAWQPTVASVGSSLGRKRTRRSLRTAVRTGTSEERTIFSTPEESVAAIFSSSTLRLDDARAASTEDTLSPEPLLSCSCIAANA